MVRAASASANLPYEAGVRTSSIAKPGADRPRAKGPFDGARDEKQAAELLHSITRRVDDLADRNRRGNTPANAEIAALERYVAESSREVGRRAERKPSEAEGFRRNDIAPARRSAPANKGASRPAAPPVVRSGLEDLPGRNPERREPRVVPAQDFAHDYAARQQRFEDRGASSEAGGHFDSTVRRLDELHRDIAYRQSGATYAEITATKDSLAALSREIGRQMKHQLQDTSGSFGRRDVHPEDYANSMLPRSANMQFFAELERQEPRIDPAARSVSDRPRDRRQPEGHWNASRDDRSPDRMTNHPDEDSRELDHDESGSADAGHDHHRHPMSAINLDYVAVDAHGRAKHFGRRQGGNGAFEARLAALTARPDRPEPAAVGAPQPDQVSAAVPDRWIQYPHQEHARAARSAEPRRSRTRPLAIACLTGLLAVTVGLAGAYFVRSRAAEPHAGITALRPFQDNAPVPELVAARPTGTLPRFAMARPQDLRFPLPELYGVYAINRGKLFELESLPGQVPDQRIAMSAAISRQSRTTVSDGHVAFVVFRRDVAESISERVPIRVVAKIKRGTSDPNTTAGDIWTIRNVALDFRVAPIDQNKDMVLLRPESPDFTLPAGRYALVIKGQAYDFTVDGPITDPAQCLERVEGANGGFVHECQPDVMATAPMPQEAPQSPPLPSKSRRHAEARAQLAEQPARPR